MTFHRQGRLLILAALLLTAALGRAQGLYYESVITGGPFKGEKGDVSRTYLMPKMMKHVNAQDKDFIVFRLDQEKMISVDVAEKTYWEQTFADMEKKMKSASAKMDKQMAEMQEQMKNLPEEQRKMMEGMFGKMGGASGETIRMTKPGESKTISGFSCTKHVAMEGDQPLMTVWVTKDVKGFAPLRKDYELLSRRMTSMNPRFMKGLIDAMVKIDGFPIRTEWGGMTTVVTKIEQRSTPESEFSVPSGFNRVAMPLDEMEGEDE